MTDDLTPSALHHTRQKDRTDSMTLHGQRSYSHQTPYTVSEWECDRGQLKCDATRAETRFRLSAKRTSPFKSAGGRQFSRLLAAEVCASAVVMLDTPRSEVVWRVLATHSIRQFPFHFPSRASPRAITFQLESTSNMTAIVANGTKTQWKRARLLKGTWATVPVVQIRDWGLTIYTGTWKTILR